MAKLTEVTLSYERQAWVIPNGAGRLWTDRVFDSETEAEAYIAANWPRGASRPIHTPVLAMVQVQAEPCALASGERHDGLR